LTPRTVTAVIVLSDAESEVRRQNAETVIDGPRLTAGAVTGIGNLTVAAPLTADSIDLRAGTGTGTATGATVNIDRASGAKFAGAGDDPNGARVSPKHFGLTQDAALAAGDLPTRADFANPNIDNMNLALRSKGGSLTFANADLISHTALTLEGATGITVPLAGTELDLLSLDAKGPMTLGGSVAALGNIKIDGALTLNGPGGAVQDQLVVAGGALTITGATSKTTSGGIGLAALGTVVNGLGGELTVGDVSTSHNGGDLVVAANGVLKAGVLDASGVRAAPVEGEPVLPVVEVNGHSTVEVAGIKATGATGASGAVGGNGGGVKVTGTSLTLGKIDTSGGRGGPTSRDVPTTRGGDAGAIELDATGSTPLVGILGDLLAVGGEGQVRDAATPLGPLRGSGNAVTVNGNLLLLANSTLGTGTTNSIRGRTVAIAGNVDTIYVSTDSLYLATSRYVWRDANALGVPEPTYYVTDVHQVRLAPAEASIVATGAVEGSTAWDLEKAPFRFSEYQGRLRVMTSSTQMWGPSAVNRLTTSVAQANARQRDTLAMPMSRENGLDIYYETAGAGPPLVLIHALPFDHNLWLYQVERFSERFRTIAMDLRGWGRSAKPHTPFALADMGNDVFGVLANAGVDGGAVVLGCSIGSKIALMLACDHPEIFKAAILVGGNSGPQPQFDHRVAAYRAHCSQRGADEFQHWSKRKACWFFVGLC
jgi:hypothetical protein